MNNPRTQTEFQARPLTELQIWGQADPSDPEPGRTPVAVNCDKHGCSAWDANNGCLIGGCEGVSHG